MQDLSYAAAALASGTLALTLMSAAVRKAREPGAGAATTRRFGVPGLIAPHAAFALLSVEALVGGMLGFEPTRRLGAVLATVLLLGVSALLMREIRRGNRQPCGCFGASSEPLGRRSLLRNVALLVLAGTAGLVPIASGRSPWEPALAGVVVYAIAASVRALHTRTLVRARRVSAATFVLDTECPRCLELLPLIAQAQRIGMSYDISAIGSAERWDQLRLEHGLALPQLLSHRAYVGLGIRGTPTALISRNGRRVKVEGDHIRLLFEPLRAGAERRRFLQLLFAAVITACQKPGGATRPRASITPDPANVFDRTCAEVSNWRATVGVYDADGNGHPTFAGWTLTRFSFTFTTVTPVAESRQQVKCNCNGKLYDDVQLCLSECKASLGCFTGICAPASGEVCVRVPGVDATFEAETRTSRIDWRPPGSPSKACLDERDRWHADTETHEAHHVQDAKDVAHEWGQKWANKPYSACAPTEGEARAKLQKQIQDDLEKERNDGGPLHAELDRRGAEFHSTPAGGTIPDPECGHCL